jgi:hypothetical protein
MVRQLGRDRRRHGGGQLFAGGDQNRRSEGIVLSLGQQVSGDQFGVGAIVGDLAGAEDMFALKELLGRLKVESIDCRQDGAQLDEDRERLASAIVHAEEIFSDDQVTGTRYRQELGQPLEDAQNDRVPKTQRLHLRQPLARFCVGHR